jgi:hypothetical protein
MLGSVIPTLQDGQCGNSGVAFRNRRGQTERSSSVSVGAETRRHSWKRPRPRDLLSPGLSPIAGPRQSKYRWTRQDSNLEPRDYESPHPRPQKQKRPPSGDLSRNPLKGNKFGSPGRTRTTDQVINSHPLYQLSYRGRNRFRQRGRRGILGEGAAQVKQRSPRRAGRPQFGRARPPRSPARRRRTAGYGPASRKRYRARRRRRPVPAGTRRIRRRC